MNGIGYHYENRIREIRDLKESLAKMTALARQFASAAYEGDEESCDRAAAKIEAVLAACKEAKEQGK